MYTDHISKHHTPSSLPSMRPYGIVKAIRTSSPPRRVSIGAVAVAADEPLPSPLTLDVLFACLPSCAFLLGIKIGCCAKLQTSYNSPFRSYTATGLRTSGRASSRWLGISKSPQMLSPCRSFLHSSGVSGLSSIGLLGLFTSSIPYPRLSARFQKLMRCRFLVLFCSILVQLILLDQRSSSDWRRFFRPIEETNRTHSTEAMQQIAGMDRAKRNY